MIRASLSASLLLVTACSVGIADPGGLPPDALQVMDQANCALCHAVPGLATPPTEVSCTGCHIWIQEVARDPARRDVARKTFPHWDRYERHVQTYLDVPSLDAALVRLEPAWVESWLLDPHDVRPRLPEGMPRFGFDTASAKTVASAFAARQLPVAKTPRPNKKNIAAGRAKMLTYGCTACHNVGAELPAAPGIPGAPDLAHTRVRMNPDRVVAWIEDPKKLSPAASMPSFDVSHEDAILIRDYLFLADPAWKVPPDDLPDVVPLTRPVRWAEVEEKVFGKICAHCHMDPDLPQNDGRRGPGNEGGFGWAATGIHLQSPEAIRPYADKIVPALLRRRAEARRDRVSPGQKPASIERPERPGMPLGLPPLTTSEIALVAAWIEQGLPE